MPDIKIHYHFSAMPWQFVGQGGWVFVSLPKKLSKEIRETSRSEEAGWGRLSAIAKIGGTEWKTAIWFDTKANTYLLPIKSGIRKKEGVIVGKKVTVHVFL